MISASTTPTLDLEHEPVGAPSGDVLVGVLSTLAKAMWQLDDASLAGSLRLTNQRDAIVDRLGHIHRDVAMLIGERELAAASARG